MHSGFTFVALVFLIASGGIAASQSPDSSAARGQAAKSGELAKAVALAEQRVESTEQNHVEALYAAARLHAQLGQHESAYLFLQRAVSAGLYDRERMLTDEAFAGYRTDDLFRTLARRAWANGYTRLLERPNREDVQKSPEIMRALAFKPGERVADIGAGSGYFTFQIADAVGPTGVVHALDIAPEMLEYLEMRVKARRATNVVVRRVASDDPQLAPSSLDTIVMIDAIHYVKDRTAYARKLLPALAPGGRLVIIDYRPRPMSERPWGPPPEQQFPSSQLNEELARAGFSVVASYDFLPEQFFVVYGVR